MTPRKDLRGVFSAIPTPMNRDGSIDFGKLDAFVDFQLDAGIDGLVPCGTTGESATMSADERQKVITSVVKRVGDRALVVAGAGANGTQTAIEHQKRAQDTGASCALVVTPYYNKPTASGLIAHYSALLEAANIPIILYNVPGRTGCDMLPETVGKLAKMPGIVAIKEATGDLDRVAAIRALAGDDFAIMTGDDGTTCPFIMMGGDGAISVASNVAPKEMVAMVHAALDGKMEAARDAHRKLRELFGALFVESNPIPLKAALAAMGLMEDNYRLPLTPISDDNRSLVKKALKNGGWM